MGFAIAISAVGAAAAVAGTGYSIYSGIQAADAANANAKAQYNLSQYEKTRSMQNDSLTAAQQTAAETQAYLAQTAAAYKNMYRNTALIEKNLTLEQQLSFEAYRNAQASVASAFTGMGSSSSSGSARALEITNLGKASRQMTQVRRQADINKQQLKDQYQAARLNTAGSMAPVPGVYIPQQQAQTVDPTAGIVSSALQGLGALTGYATSAYNAYQTNFANQPAVGMPGSTQAGPPAPQ